MSFNFMAAVTICSDFGAQENKACHCFRCFPIYLPWSDGTGCHEMMGLDAMISVFQCWVSSQLFHSISLSSRGSLDPLHFVSSAYLRLLIFLPAILIPSCASSSPAFLMMYSAYKLNKQSDNIQPWSTPFPILSQSVVPCKVLTVVYWTAYRFLKKGKMIWYSHPFRIVHSSLWSTQSKALAWSMKQK